MRYRDPRTVTRHTGAHSICRWRACNHRRGEYEPGQRYRSRDSLRYTSGLQIPSKRVSQSRVNSSPLDGFGRKITFVGRIRASRREPTFSRSRFPENASKERCPGIRVLRKRFLPTSSRSRFLEYAPIPWVIVFGFLVATCPRRSEASCGAPSDHSPRSQARALPTLPPNQRISDSRPTFSESTAQPLVGVLNRQGVAACFLHTSGTMRDDLCD